MPALIKDIDFSTATQDYAAVAAGNSLFGVGGSPTLGTWIDVTGNKASLGGSPRKLTVTNGVLYNNSEMRGILDQRVVLVISDWTQGWNIRLRHNVVVGDNITILNVSTGGAFGVQLNLVGTGNGNYANDIQGGTIPAATPMVLIAEVITTTQGASSIKFRVSALSTFNFTTLTSSVAWLINYTATISALVTPNGGAPYISRWEGSGGNTPNFTVALQSTIANRILLYNAVTTLTAPIIISKYGDPTKVTFGCDVSPGNDALGGLPPFTYRWYSFPLSAISNRFRDDSTSAPSIWTDPDNVASTPYLIPGQTGNGTQSIDVPIPNDGSRRFVQLTVKDANSVKVSSNTTIAIPWKTPLGIVWVGDSFTDGLGQTISSPDEATVILTNWVGPRYINSVNKGVSIAYTSDWLPTNDSEYTNTLGNLSGPTVTAIQSMRAAFPTMKIIVPVCLGLNDSVNSVAASVYAARMSRLIAPFLTAGADTILLNAPPAVTGIPDRAQKLLDYTNILPSLDNGTTIRFADKTAYDLVGTLPQQLNGPSLGHPSDTFGRRSQGARWASAIYTLLYGNVAPSPPPPAAPLDLSKAAKAYEVRQQAFRTFTASQQLLDVIDGRNDGHSECPPGFNKP